MQVGDLVRIKEKSVWVSDWMHRARSENMPLLIIEKRDCKSGQNDYMQSQYKVLYREALWWVYEGAIGYIEHEGR